MIRAQCPQCQYAQEFADSTIGTDTPCQWCSETMTIGGPTAEYIPDAGRPTVVSFAEIFSWWCSALAFVFGVVAVVGLPVLDFGLGWRWGGMRPIGWFWLLFLVAGVFASLGEWLRGSRPTTPSATGR